jgi:hypothetical protein
VNVKTAAQRALYNNLGKDEALALAVDAAVQGSLQDGWKTNSHEDKQEGADRHQGGWSRRHRAAGLGPVKRPEFSTGPPAPLTVDAETTGFWNWQSTRMTTETLQCIT